MGGTLQALQAVPACLFQKLTIQAAFSLHRARRLAVAEAAHLFLRCRADRYSRAHAGGFAAAATHAPDASWHGRKWSLAKQPAHQAWS
jgi:hypothetical protein